MSSHAHAVGSEHNYLNHQKGLKSWLTTLDHKRIGLMYLYSILFFFLLGGIFALIVRTELLSGTKFFLSADQYNKAFTYHGTIMVFMVILPLIPSALGNLV